MRWPLRKPTGRLATIGHDYDAGHKAYVEGLGPGERLWLRTKPFRAPPNEELERCLHTFAHIADRFDFDLRPQVLDVGSGPGWLSELLARCGYWVTGIDISEDMTQIAAERIAAIPRPISEALDEPMAEFHAIPVREIPWSGRFDLAVLYDTMHHFDDEVETLRVIHRALAPGGWIYLEEGVRPPPGSEAERHLIAEMEQHRTLESPFEPEYLVQVFERAGFEDVRRYARIDELFEIGGDKDAVALLRRRLRYPDLNTIVARKPGGDGREPFRARIELRNSPQRRGDALVFDLAVTNTGRSWWPAGGDGVPPGVVTIGAYADRGGTRVELPRGRLPRGVAAGERVELELVVPIATLPTDVASIEVDLVREGIAWFSELGSTPLELQLPR